MSLPYFYQGLCLHGASFRGQSYIFGLFLPGKNPSIPSPLKALVFRVCALKNFPLHSVKSTDCTSVIIIELFQ